jgi:ubiquinone/menaquinone biosynthesis C-methylase UbiE
MNKLANSFKLLTNKNVEYELRVGSYKNGKYTSHLPKESYDKVLNNKSLFSSNKNATTTSITLITQYKGIRKVQVLDSKYKEVKHYFEDKKTLDTIQIEGTSMRVSITQEEIMKNKNNTMLGTAFHTRLRKRTSKVSADGLWQFDMTEVYYDTPPANKMNNKTLGEPSYSVEVEYIHPLNKNNNKSNKSALLPSLTNIINTITTVLPETKQPVDVSIMSSILRMFSRDSKYNNRYLIHKTLDSISMTSLMNQVLPLEFKSLPCITKGYAVTEKADGLRYFIYIDAKGLVYQIQNTKEITLLDITLSANHSSIYNTLIDVEYIEDVTNINGNSANNSGNSNSTSTNKSLKSPKTSKSKSPKVSINKSPKTSKSKSPKVSINKSPKTSKSKSPKTSNNVTVGGSIAKDGLYLMIDVLIHNGVDLTNEKLVDRIAKLKEVAKLLPKNWKPKKYHFTTDKKQIHSLAKSVFTPSKYKYNLDGLIFTPTGEPCADQQECKGEFHKDNVMGGYFGRIYKWKPQRMNTIDFLVREVSKGLYYLFVSMSIGKYKNMLKYNNSDYKLDSEYKKLFPTHYKAVSDSLKNNGTRQGNIFFPYYFKTREFPELYKISGDVSTTSIDLTNMDNKVVEFECIVDKINTLTGWKPERVRTDKTEGNGWGTADRTLKLVLNPITEEMLFNPIANKQNAYYKSNKTGQNRNKSKIWNLRGFHNFIKDSLYRKYISRGDSVIEIAGGQGGDLWKLKKQGVKSLLLTNISENGLKEAQRRFNDNKHKTMTLNTLAGNFGTNMTNAIKTKLSGTNPVDVVAIQFAFHYFLKSKATLDSIFKNIDTFLKKGGFFIFTTYDGEIINERLKKDGKFEVLRDGESVVDIIKGYTGDKLKNYGQAIDVKCETFVKHETEYLVNYEYVLEYFKKKGYDVVESENFMTKLPNYKGTPLDTVDQGITGLHRYTVLTKL